ncbi:type I-B CRISPR-associated protein Cas5b [Sporolactobacillus putidus]|uniref:Uncharacterized protein n=1 Tax=Sporolactobacillus putidus TaxID=492735 RepID=A0A917S769_9BACL|nr:type I-B CRISPR-associated protein Cas5b [Sporolactobacillus putidus]GGL59326.1 hypothetical protein GCM10007968_24140 [Sporolactobacillus putidus]
MEGIAFELSGKTAFFKKPDVNEYAYFTYSHIHKIALLGLLGAILGLGGYWQQYQSLHDEGENETNCYPEFYKILHSLDLAIVPHGDRGYFAKKIQAFNNSVGYASQEDGGNLIVREQWLENPHWTIYITKGDLTSQIFSKLCSALLNRVSIYIPYLGKNDHPALISDARMIQLDPADQVEGIDSLFPVDGTDFERRGTVGKLSSPYYFSEWMPISLNATTNHYELKELAHTNKRLQQVKDLSKIYQAEMRTLYFI